MRYYVYSENNQAKTKSRVLILFYAVALIMFLATPGIAQWKIQKIAVKASFRGLSVVNKKVVWVSGTNGTIMRTLNGGKNWDISTVSGAEQLDFRDVEAFSENLAYTLSIGPGTNSRIYKTIDGGRSWDLQFENKDKTAFFDALAFWDSETGLAMSDPVGGRFLILRTLDGGRNWKPIESIAIPPALEGEGGFAGSGTCLVTKGKTEAYLVSGGMASRIYHTDDRGQTWSVQNTPIISGSAGSGIFSVAFAAIKWGILMGGDYQKPDLHTQNAAISQDGGKTWELSVTQPAGYRSGVDISITKQIALAVGPTGTDISYDFGQNWTNIDKENFNVVKFSPDTTAWAAGPNGRIGRLKIRKSN